MSYSDLSEFALSWAVAGMAGFFVLMVGWVFRPGSRRVHDDAARSIFRHDSHPEAGPPAPGEKVGA